MTQTDIVDPRISEEAPVAGSNSLPELAARIRAEHEATGAALKSIIDHSIAAGEFADRGQGQGAAWSMAAVAEGQLRDIGTDGAALYAAGQEPDRDRGIS